jgi:membrane-associated phospholipid phosphatase
VKLSLAAFALFLATAIAVDAGAFHSLDQHAVAHWMPWFRPRHHRLRDIVLPATDGSPLKRLLNLWIYPASIVVSGVIVGLVAWHRRSPRWAVAWIAGNAIEGAGKLIVSRPALRWHGRHIAAFDHSLPSGHTIRSLLVAGAIAWSWRTGRVAWAWALSVPVVLVLLGHHVPLDCVAGVFVAIALLNLDRFVTMRS